MKGKCKLALGVVNSIVRLLLFMGGLGVLPTNGQEESLVYPNSAAEAGANQPGRPEHLANAQAVQLKPTERATVRVKSRGGTADRDDFVASANNYFTKKYRGDYKLIGLRLEPNGDYTFESEVGAASAVSTFVTTMAEHCAKCHHVKDPRLTDTSVFRVVKEAIDRSQSQNRLAPLAVSNSISAFIDYLRLQQSQYSDYCVKPGDSLRTIAEKFGLSISSIRTANNMHTSALKTGRILAIPPRDAATIRSSAEIATEAAYLNAREMALATVVGLVASGVLILCGKACWKIVSPRQRQLRRQEMLRILEIEKEQEAQKRRIDRQRQAETEERKKKLRVRREELRRAVEAERTRIRKERQALYLKLLKRSAW